MQQCSVGFVGEAIPHPWFRQQVSGTARVWFDLLSKLSHQDTKMFRLFVAVRTPDRFQNRSMGQNPTGMRDEQRQQLEFLRGESDFEFTATHAVPVSPVSVVIIGIAAEIW